MKKIDASTAARLSRWLPVLSALIVLGCGTTGVLDERLDPASGLTVLVQREPLIFARTDPRYSRSARDYLYLGPIETNDRGTREYFLWLGIGSTLDRNLLALPAEVPTTLYIELTDDLLALPLAAWNEREPGLGLRELYRTPVHIDAELAARVTLNQLELLAEAPMRSLRVATVEGATIEYFRWNDTKIQTDFVAR